MPFSIIDPNCIYVGLATPGIAKKVISKRKERNPNAGRKKSKASSGHY
jgi:hypothetical protein